MTEYDTIFAALPELQRSTGYVGTIAIVPYCHDQWVFSAIDAGLILCYAARVTVLSVETDAVPRINNCSMHMTCGIRKNVALAIDSVVEWLKATFSMDGTYTASSVQNEQYDIYDIVLS